jgi:hypothetical protein
MKNFLIDERDLALSEGNAVFSHEVFEHIHMNTLPGMEKRERGYFFLLSRPQHVLRNVEIQIEMACLRLHTPNSSITSHDPAGFPRGRPGVDRAGHDTDRD